MSNGKFKPKDRKIELSTNFSVEKNVDKSKLIISILRDRFGLVCSIDICKNKNYVVIISKESVKLFQEIVAPYIISSLKYKIGLDIYSNSYNHKTKLLIRMTNSMGNRFYSTNNKPSKSYNPISVASSYSNPILLKSIIYKENRKRQESILELI